MRAPFYFAYGSNMSTARLLERVSGAEVRGPARLEGWRLVFDKPSRDGSAKANVSERADGVVWGVAWRLPEGAWSVLDRFEPGYERTRCSVVEAGGATAVALTYVYRGPGCASPPFDWYVDHLLAGAREHGLPADYRRALVDWRARAVAPPAGAPRRDPGGPA